GSDGSFRAQVEGVDDPFDKKALLRATHALIAAIDGGALPLRPGKDRALVDAVASLVRAVTDLEGFKTAANDPFSVVVEKLAKVVAARAGGEHAACDLERMMVEASQELELPKATRQRLWGQVVEVMKRLDVYDPSAGNDLDDVSKLQRKLIQAGLPKP